MRSTRRDNASTGSRHDPAAERRSRQHDLTGKNVVEKEILAEILVEPGAAGFRPCRQPRYRALLAAARKRLHPHTDEATLEHSSFLLMSLGESTMRLAISVGKEEGAALVEIYKRMALRKLEQT